MIDFDLEKSRLQKRKSELESHHKSAEKTLKNNNFLKNAPDSVIETKTRRLNEMRIELDKLISNLEMLN